MCSTIITLLLFALLVLLLVRFDLVGVIVFAFTPIFAFEALLLAARMVLLTFKVVVLEFFAAEVALTAFSSSSGTSRANASKLPQGTVSCCSSLDIWTDRNTILCRRRRQMVGLFVIERS